MKPVADDYSLQSNYAEREGEDAWHLVKNCYLQRYLFSLDTRHLVETSQASV